MLAGLVREGVVSPPLTPGRGLTVEHPRGATLSELLAELGLDRGER